MAPFTTKPLPSAPDVMAPDGSEVRILLRLAGGSMAHFRLAAGQVSRPVKHRTVEEIWFVTAGSGQMWRSQGGREEIVDLVKGLSLTIPLGTAFQFRAGATEPLEAVAITLPPWPGEAEAVPATGPWTPSV